MLKTIFTILAFFMFTWVAGQTSTFKAEIYTDSLRTIGGSVIFPLTHDTITINKSGIAEIDLKNPKRRVFYFSWTNWKSKIFKLNDACANLIHKVSVPDTLFYKPYQTLKKCPVCLSGKNLIPIRYGYPSKNMFKKAERGKIKLGGCIIYDWTPLWYCSKDKFEF